MSAWNRIAKIAKNQLPDLEGVAAGDETEPPLPLGEGPEPRTLGDPRVELDPRVEDPRPRDESPPRAMLIRVAVALLPRPREVPPPRPPRPRTMPRTPFAGLPLDEPRPLVDVDGGRPRDMAMLCIVGGLARPARVPCFI